MQWCMHPQSIAVEESSIAYGDLDLQAASCILSVTFWHGCQLELSAFSIFSRDVNMFSSLLRYVTSFLGQSNFNSSWQKAQQTGNGRLMNSNMSCPWSNGCAFVLHIRSCGLPRVACSPFISLRHWQERFPVLLCFFK